MKSSKRTNQIVSFIYLFIFSFVFVTLLGIGTGFAATKPITSLRTQSYQCIKIIKALEQYHYLGSKLDNAMSAKIFDQYIKNLDPSRQLFTQKDMDTIAPYKYKFDQDLKRGNLAPAYDIFNLYLSRSVLRLEYILKLIKTWETDMDFSTNDVLSLDYETRPFQKRLEDLYPLWKKELKNHIITMKLDNQKNDKISKSLEKIYANRLKRLSQTNTNDVFQIFMNSVTTSFDPHTQYFAPRVSEDFDIHMSLSLEGIGAVLQNEYEFTKVVRLIPKGPADKSHLLMPGDKIIAVGQGKNGELKDTIGERIDDVVKLIRGPKNTYVRLKLIPAKKADSTTTISIKRDKVKLEEQSAKKKVVTVTQGNKNFKIGIIEIPNFYLDFAAYNRGEKDYKSTTKDVQKILFELKKEKVDGVIVDLRDNGGGSLKESNDLTGLFLKSGPIVQIKTKHRITRLYDENPSIEYTGPLVVLINRMSASASEIFAGAIKDYHRGIIVGTKSFGKGTVQELKPLDKGKLKLTTAKFYRVSGASTQNMGVVPDLKYPQIYKIKHTGESSLDGALPWDTIKKTHYKAYKPLDPVYAFLRKNYQKRILHDPGMIYLEERIDLTNRINGRQTLSLNLAQRKKRIDSYTSQELKNENEYRVALGKKPLKSLDNEDVEFKDPKEIMMEQTHHVMADFITIAAKLGYSW
ncbi:MAG: tail-specific protease [Desulfobacteraceae bacterium]|nr:tail-specific protease [Desulfobacteraceae bacterium]